MCLCICEYVCVYKVYILRLYSVKIMMGRIKKKKKNQPEGQVAEIISRGD